MSTNKIQINGSTDLRWEVPDSKMGPLLAVLRKVGHPQTTTARNLQEEQGRCLVMLNLDQPPLPGESKMTEEQIRDLAKRMKARVGPREVRGTKVDTATGKPPIR